jgi:putative lipoic acid-binding regulatory protein
VDGEAEFTKRESLLAFPTEFPIKIMGRREGNFAQGVMEIVLKHSPEFDPKTLEMRPSRKGKYLGITVTIQAKSREQLDGLYRELCDHPSVVMVL